MNTEERKGGSATGGVHAACGTSSGGLGGRVPSRETGPPKRDRGRRSDVERAGELCEGGRWVKEWLLEFETLNTKGMLTCA